MSLRRKQSTSTTGSSNNTVTGGIHLVLPFTILLNPSMVANQHQNNQHNNSPLSTNHSTMSPLNSSIYSKFKSSPSSSPIQLSSINSSPSIHDSNVMMNTSSGYNSGDLSSLDSVSISTNTKSNNQSSTTSNNNGNEFKNTLELQLQWLDIMKQEFLKYIEKNAKLSNEMELKMVFLEHFYDPITERVPIKLFKSIPDVLQRLDLFCMKVLKWLLPEDWIEIEKVRIEKELSQSPLSTLYFYLNSLSLKLETTKLFKHEYLKDFIQEQAKWSAENLSTTTTIETSTQSNDDTNNLDDQTKQVLSTADQDQEIEIQTTTSKPKTQSETTTSSPSNDNDTSGSKEKDSYKYLLEQVKLICSMFSLELGDWFNFFEFKKRKKFKKWFESGLKNQCVPKYVLEIYKRKKESTEKGIKEFNFKMDDFNQKNIIESDWYYTNWVSNQHTDDWYVTYSDIPNVVQWNSDVDRSVDKLGLKNTKIIGYVDYSVSHSVKSNVRDEHLKYLFGDVNWYSFTPINMAHSIHKYPHALMITTFKFGPLFAAREIQNVFSSKSSFLGNRMTEGSVLFKSSDYLNDKNTETKDLIKVPFIGGRIFNMIDKNRTRYIEIRTLNIGGLLGKKILYSNPLTSKKLCLQNYNGFLKAVKENEQKGHPLPSPEENYLSKLLHNYCTVYWKIDLTKDNVL